VRGAIEQTTFLAITIIITCIDRLPLPLVTPALSQVDLLQPDAPRVQALGAELPRPVAEAGRLLLVLSGKSHQGDSILKIPLLGTGTLLIGWGPSPGHAALVGRLPCGPPLLARGDRDVPVGPQLYGPRQDDTTRPPELAALAHGAEARPDTERVGGALRHTLHGHLPRQLAGLWTAAAYESPVRGELPQKSRGLPCFSI
jgi:hypothetical protein